jgi:hypothetical protein
MPQDPQLPEIKLDPAHLYREETFTDRRAGTLRRLVPVDAQGRDDGSRPVIYEGHASLMTPGGALPLQFQIDANSLEDALRKFPEVARQALEHTLEELRRLQREAQSSIVVPGAGGPGAVPGGGRIKF